jgi:SAM-dependent methyltransferase
VFVSLRDIEPSTEGEVNSKLTWRDEHTCRVRDTDFALMHDLVDLHAQDSISDCFVLGKNRRLIDDLLKIHETTHVKRIVDLGIFKGGSMALYALLFEPVKLVGIEYATDIVAPLREFIDRHNLTESVRPYYGVDQADDARVRSIVDTEFAGEDIDLVVDDASHYYFETRASFNTLFPYLRPGGLYILEDWGWAHWPGDLWQKSQAFETSRPALSNLVFEFCMLSASRLDLVESVQVTFNSCIVCRGSGNIPRGSFKIEDCYLTRDRSFKPSM